MLELVDTTDGFMHLDGRDLTGYVDGTENPHGQKAQVAALDPTGASCVAVQCWRHDFAAWDALDAAAQEDFEPEAFVLRRSMP